jgi:sugar phosphate isomerase/epimerase
MSTSDDFSRRSFLALTAAAPFTAKALGADTHIPVGLELYSVRGDLAKDVMGTVRAVAQMGYECVEFYAPYYDWTPEYAKQVRKELDDLGIRCSSTHNNAVTFAPGGLQKALDLNQIIGSGFVVMASAGKLTELDAWKRVAETLNRAAEAAKPRGLRLGYHNHALEWAPIGGTKPIELLAAQTDKSVMLQLDVGTCVESGNDPVAWIGKNPGRIRSIHCKDWSPAKGYQVLFAEGVSPWKDIFAAAEKTGGVEFYLIEQEGASIPELEAAKQCLAAYRRLRA